MNRVGSKKLFLANVYLVVGFATAAFWYCARQNEAGFGDLKMNTVVPAEGRPSSVAISTDGSAVAMMHSKFSGGVSTEVIEVRDVQSGLELRKFSLPPLNWAHKKIQYS